MRVGLYRERKVAKERRAEGPRRSNLVPPIREGLRNIRRGSERHRKLLTWLRRHGASPRVRM